MILLDEPYPRPAAGGAARGNRTGRQKLIRVLTATLKGPGHGSRRPAFQRPQGPKWNGVSERPPPPIFSLERASRQGTPEAFQY